MSMIESVIKTSPVGRWYIELSDMAKEDDPENRIICLSIEEYSQKIEALGAEYGEDIEVVWSSDENVTPVQINEVRQEIMAYEARVEAEKDQTPTHNSDGTPNFNA